MFSPSFDEIRKLASRKQGKLEFCRDFLVSVSELADAQAGAVWDCSREPFEVVCQHSRGEPARLSLTREAHEKLLSECVKESKPLVLRPARNGSETDTAPTILIGKFERFGNQLVELFVDQLDSREKEEGIVNAFTTALAIATETSENAEVANNQSSNLGPIRFSQDDISSYMAAIHGSIDRKLACANVANETRRLLDCDRVSVLLKHRGQFRLFAISGQVTVNRRSNTVRLLEQLSRKLLKTGQTFWYPDEAEIPKQIGSLLDEYLAQTATRSLIVEPIYEKVEDRVVDPDSHERKRNLVIGGLVYEHCHEQWSKESVASAIEFTSLHSGNAIRNGNQHHDLFLFPVLNLLGKSRVLAAPRVLPKTLLVLAAAIIASAILMFWQVDFYVSADGVLVPQNRHRIYALANGDVAVLQTEHGKSVQQGETLLVMTSRELDLRIKEIESNIRNAKQRLQAIKDRRFEKKDDQNSEENVKLLESEIASYIEQKQILDESKEDLIIRSPIDGQVITFDLERRLAGRPVQNGQVLMEVADPEGEWELEIHLEDRRIGHLLRAMEESGNKGLPVTFLLAADTTTRFSGELHEVSRATEVNADNKQSIRLRVKIDPTKVKIDQSRTGVTAKIICGRSSLGYLWLHDIKEFFQKNVLFYFA